MAPRASKSKAAPAPTTTETKSIGPPDDTPPQLFVLPEGCSPDARFISLHNPATTILTRYLYCPKTGFHELTKLGGNGSTPKSCLLAPQASENEVGANGLPSDDTTSAGSLVAGYVLQDARLLVATLFDPIFFLLPLFKPEVNSSTSGRSSLARMADDYLDELAETSAHMGQLLKRSKVRTLMTKHLGRICERIDVAGETAYKMDHVLLWSTLLAKARSVVEKAWPKSLEEHTQKQLEMPVVAQAAVSESDSANPLVKSDAPASTESEASVNGLAVNLANGEDMMRRLNDLDPAVSVEYKLRLRTALSFILSSYVSKEWRMFLEGVTAKNEVYDFSDLDERLQAVKQAKSKAQALRSLSDNISRKRSMAEDEEATEARLEKKRKKEEEEKKRKTESRATRDLKKVNTTGMKKMSSFFTRQTSSASG